MELSVKTNRVAITISFVCLIAFLLVAFLRGSFAEINAGVNSWATTINNSPFTVVAKLIADGFDTTPLLVVSLVIGLVMFLLKMKRNAVILVGAMIGDAVILEALKTFIYSPRPLDALILETDNSFPSGHATTTVVFFGLIAFFALQTWKSKRVKVSSTMLVAALALFVGFTRIYLNVHWFTDVLAAYFLGIFWLAFCIIITPYLVKIYYEHIKKTNFKS